MPLYVVRWPDLSAALVRAANDDELLEILDQVADPQGCAWAEYDGPLFLEFELAAHVEVERPPPGPNGAPRPLDPEHIRVVGADKLASRQAPPMTVYPAGDSGHEMLEAVARFAFPATAAAYWDDDPEPDSETLEQALRTDMLRPVEPTGQRHAQPDPAAQFAINLAASMHWVKSQCESVVELARNANEAAGLVLKMAATVSDHNAHENGPDVFMTCLDLARTAWLEKRDPSAIRRLLLQALLLMEERP